MTDTTANKAFTDETAARRFLEESRWPEGAYCPFCGQSDTIKALPAKGAMGAGWYHCRECRKKFTVRVGTLYERSHVPLHKWLFATHLLCSSKKGMSAHQLHRLLGVTYKTAWFMAHRIREGMRESKIGPLGGQNKVVEADETYIGGKEKNKHANKRIRQGRGAVGKEAAFALVEREGKVRSFHVPDVNAKTLRPILVSQISRKSWIMTDESAVKEEFGCLITRMNAAYRLRNTLVHSDWRRSEGPNAIKPRVLLARGKIKIAGYNLPEEHFTPERFVAEAQKIQRLARDFHQFAVSHFGLKRELPPEQAPQPRNR